MSFIESPRFPEDIAPDPQGGPLYSTDLVAVASGYEKRNQNWAAARHEFDVGYTRNQAQLDALLAFFHAVKGRAYGFRYKDHADYAVAVAAGRLGTGSVGDGTPDPFQLVKRYTSGANTTDREIKKPVSGTVSLYKNAALQTPTTHYTLDTTTGLVMLAALDAKAVSGHSVGATHQFTTATNLSGLAIGEKVYLTGISGTAAGILNGLAHTISNKTGTGPYTWTINTSTAGLTASGGTAHEYPQAADVFTWSGEFDVPVRFDTDKLSYQMLPSSPAGRLYQLPSLPLLEIKL